MFTGGVSFAAASCLPGLPCVVAHSGTDNDPKSEDGACDADFMNQIYARAAIEADRELSVAGQNIRKPDSVLEYSCFDAMAKAGLSTINPYFSADTSTAGAKTPATKQHADFIKPALEGYVNTLFSHDYVIDGSGQDFSTGKTTCDYMKSIRTITRCMDFDTIGNQFYSFDTLAGVDPRVKPDGNACGGTGITSDLVSVAGNDGFQYARFDVFTDYKAAVSGACAPPVGTGVYYDDARKDGVSWTALGQLIFGTAQTVEHKVCVNPGCYYDPFDDDCKAK